MATINHGSLYAQVPEEAAKHLAALIGGLATPFHPCEGGWVCFLGGDKEDWEGPLIEFYPRTMTMAFIDGRTSFRKLDGSPARGGGSHFNISVDKTREELENVAQGRGLTATWRDWGGFLDVWLDDELLIECVPRSSE